MSFCSNCGTEVAENINFCGNCGKSMQNKECRETSENIDEKVVTGYYVATQNMGILTLEIIIIAIIAGAYLKSWYAFGGVLLGLWVLYFAFKEIAILFNSVFTVIWGILGYLLGYYFNDEKHFTQASVVLCLVGLLFSAAIHFSISGVFHKKEEE